MQGRTINRRTTEMNIRNVPVGDKDAFKSYCARHGYTVQAATIALIRMAYKKDLVLQEAQKKDSSRQHRHELG